MTDEQLAREAWGVWRDVPGRVSWEEMAELYREHWLLSVRRVKGLVIREFAGLLVEALNGLLDGKQVEEVLRRFEKP